MNFFEKPKTIDILILGFFVALVTWQPYFLHHEIIMLEAGIHLPAINALSHGAVPYRDFFFLRGPLELYVPALMIWLGNMNMIFLPVFYYAGTILTLLFCVIIGRYLFRSRWVFYVMVIILVARTFPRIAYYYWGGMRYALGFAALICALLYFRTNNRRWMLACGAVSALVLLTSVDSGVSVVVAVIAALAFAFFFQPQGRTDTLKGCGQFVVGLFIFLIPFGIYLLATNSLGAFCESTWMVVRVSNAAFPGEYGVKPETIFDWIFAFWPGSRYFRFMTPAFCFLLFAVFVVRKIRQGRSTPTHAFLVGMAVYGFVLYMAAFRKIEGHHFEMALQAEKFLLFFMVEEALLFLQGLRIKLSGQKIKVWGINAILFVFVLNALWFSFQRFDHRFTAVKWIKKHLFGQEVTGLSLLEKEKTQVLHIQRADGITVPDWQAQEITGVVQFLKESTKPDETVFCYPEVGNFNFWADRPFVGRFPVATFSWISEDWYQELLADFKRAQPKYVVMTNLGHRTFPWEWYFRNQQNIERFNITTKMILDQYEVVRKFESVSIYQRKNSKEARGMK